MRSRALTRRSAPESPAAAESPRPSRTRSRRITTRSSRARWRRSSSRSPTRSPARGPGARGDSLEEYVERLREFEEIASRQDGVERVYAMRAGREIRVVVDPGAVDDERAALLSHEIASAIEREMEYPGQIRITVIRETRTTSYAS